MDTVPILLAIGGFGLLAWEIWSFIFFRRELKTGRLSRPWRRRRIIAFVIGVLIVLTIPWQAYPLGDGTAAGIPFFAAWFDAKGRDFTGAITLPALLGNLAVWLFLPQLVLALVARKHLRSQVSCHAPEA